MRAHGANAWVRVDAEAMVLAQLKGRSIEAITNDRVVLDTQTDPPQIIEVLERRNSLLRQEGHREKRLAANIDLALVILSGEPSFSPETTLRVMAGLIAQQIPFLLVVNKSDLDGPTQMALRSLLRIQPLPETAPEWPWVLANSIQVNGLDALHQQIELKCAAKSALESPSIALMGESGMGKSSLLNALVPDAKAQTQAISEALSSGRHTTTSSQAYRMVQAPGERALWLIDTPGFQRFGISHLDRGDIESIFPEWAWLQKGGFCRFQDCTHLHEPGCVVQAAIEAAATKGQVEWAKELKDKLGLWERLLSSASAPDRRSTR
jgi:ribosome biogenesis GTPase